MRLMQHKKEAYWFYRFLSIFYDNYVNPFFWTEKMREQALELAELSDPHLQVIDVGSGTGFTTQGIVKYIDAHRITCIDQSPHQMAKAKLKGNLQGCTFKIGDAENLPAATDQFDRYVSAGSIEYWPNPQRGIAEAYRVIKPGGLALLVGPLEPGTHFGRFFANLWMLFPKEKEYLQWFGRAGFTDIRTTYVRPHWHQGKYSEYGIAIAGVKPVPGPSPIHEKAGEIELKKSMTPVRWLKMASRVLIGSLAGFIFIPVALLGYLRSSLKGQSGKSLTIHQVGALVIILVSILFVGWLVFVK